MYFTTFFGYLVDQLNHILVSYGLAPSSENNMQVVTTDNVTEIVQRLFNEDRLSTDEKNNINVLVLRDDEEPDMTTVQNMKPLQQWFQIVTATDLVHVIENRAIQIAFQPIVSVAEHRVFGYELLSRGVSPDGEIIAPGKLFADARRLNLTFNLDRVARENALRVADTMSFDGHLFVNFLPSAIYDPEYCLKTTMAVARQLSIPRDRIVFEIVESETFDDIDHLKKILNYYRGHGVKTALDDVGSGYSSLNILASLRPDIMKLDMDLIRGIDGDRLKQSIFNGLAGIAADNGIQVLAEGVETRDELAFLMSHGVDLLQGYYFSKPRTAPDYELPDDAFPAPV